MIIIIIIIIIIITVITLMQGIYCYISELNLVSEVYSVAASQYLQLMLHVILFHMLNALYIIIIIIIIIIDVLNQYSHLHLCSSFTICGSKMC